MGIIDRTMSNRLRWFIARNRYRHAWVGARYYECINLIKSMAYTEDL